MPLKQAQAHPQSNKTGARSASLRSLRSPLRSLDPELLHPELQRAAIDAEPPRCAFGSGENPSGVLQRPEDVGALGVFERSVGGAHIPRGGALIDVIDGNVEPLAPGSDDRPLDQVL